VSAQANVELADGIPFVSDTDLQAGLDQAGVDPALSQAIVDENAAARLDGLKAALAILALMSVIALFFSRRIPTEPTTSAGPRTPGDEAMVVALKEVG